jgi:hypothetical protein
MMPNNINFFDLLNKIGIPLTPDSPPVLIYSCVIFVLAILCLLSFVNIMIYFTSLYVLNHEKLISRLPNWPILFKLLKLSNSFRISLIIFEIVLFLVCISTIIYGSWQVISVMFT